MNHDELRGRIRARYLNQAAFAKAVGMAPATVSLKLCGKRTWTVEEVRQVCAALAIPMEEAHLYFF